MCLICLLLTASFFLAIRLLTAIHVLVFVVLDAHGQECGFEGHCHYEFVAALDARVLDGGDVVESGGTCARMASWRYLHLSAVLKMKTICDC